MTDDRIERVWERTRDLRPIIEAHRGEGDVLRHLPDPIADAFLKANVYRLLVPVELGGEGVDPITYYELADEVSSYDASAGWNYAIGATGGVVLGGLGPKRLRAIVSSPDCGVAGGGAPLGRAVAVQGGYRLTGRWSWASGIHHARWVLAYCPIFDGERLRTSADGAPMVYGFLLPKEAVTVLDAWHVGGMRGTGSTEFEVAQAFVPEDLVLRLLSGEVRHSQAIFRMPATFFGFNHCCVLTGAARSAVSSLKTLAASKTSSMTGAALRDDVQAQYSAAKAEALIESSVLNVKEAFRRLWTKVVANEPVPLATRAHVRRACAHATECAVEAVHLCYRAAGGTAVFESAPFERALRDVNAAASHITLRYTMMEEAGRVAFGLPPRNPLF
jgi:alkylation response protein AidB-like acyl-CoA dehydrogenase